jgi:hypothetical protein
MAALRAERAVPMRCAFGLAGSGIEFDDIGWFLSWLFSTRKEKPGLWGGGVNGLHGYSVRAPVDDAGRTGRMSVNAERPRAGEEDSHETGKVQGLRRRAASSADLMVG